MTNHIVARGNQHREGLVEGFTKRYGSARRRTSSRYGGY
jgi:hypothetical protein